MASDPNLGGDHRARSQASAFADFHFWSGITAWMDEGPGCDAISIERNEPLHHCPAHRIATRRGDVVQLTEKLRRAIRENVQTAQHPRVCLRAVVQKPKELAIGALRKHVAHISRDL